MLGSILLTGCGQAEVELPSHEQTQSLTIAEQPGGTIEAPFSTSPNIEQKAVLVIDGATEVADYGDQGALIVSDDKRKLYRSTENRVPWSSAELEGEVTSATFVQAGDREWIIAIVDEGDDKNRILVFDAYAHSYDDEPLRTQDFDGKALNFRDEVLYTDNKKLMSYDPNHGSSRNVKLPSGTTLLAPSSTGYIVEKDDRISSVAFDKEAAWDSEEFAPEGFEKKAKNKIVGFSNSIIALEWSKKGEDPVTTFHNANTGEVFATTNEIVEDGSMSKTIGSAESSPFVFLGPLVVQTNTGEITAHSEEVASISNQIVYLADGSGEDVFTGKKAWREDQNGEAPELIWQDSAYIPHEGDMYIFNTKD